VENFEPRVILTVANEPTEFFFNEQELGEFENKFGVNSSNLVVLALLWVSLLADTPVNHSFKPRRVFTRFFGRLKQRPLETIKEFSLLYDALTTSVRRSQDSVTLDTFIDGFKDTPVFKEYHEFYKTKDPQIFKFLSSFLLLGKKYYYEDPAFDETAFRGWSEVEDRLGKLTFDQRYLSDIHEIMQWMFRYVDTTDFLPSHGGGAVAERGTRRLCKKNDLLASGLDLDIDLLGPGYIATQLLDTGISDMAKDRTSRLKFVPKDIGKSRSICMEPAVYQWLQQGVRL